MINSTASSIPGWYVELQAALLRQAPRPGEIDQVTAEGWINNQKGLKKNLFDCLLPSPAVTPAEPQKPELLLEVVGTVIVTATTEKFLAKEKFVLDTGRKAKVKISYLGDNFKSCFGDKVEDPIGEQVLRHAKLRKASVDGPIITELGGEAKAETTLSEIYGLMAKQPNGEKGALLNNGWANIFYVRDNAGVLRAVYVCWHVGGWRVYAHPIEDPRAWRDGSQVFSRNSVLKFSDTPVPAQA